MTGLTANTNPFSMARNWPHRTSRCGSWYAPFSVPQTCHIFRTNVVSQMVILFCIVFSGSVTNFFPTVVQTLGYGKIESLLLTAPPYVLGVICTFTNAWHAGRTGER